VDFHELEKAGWSERGVVEAYERAIIRLTTQSVEPLLEAAGVGRGTRLLDLATGLGQTAAAAAARGAAVTGLDFSPAMIERARALHPGIDFVEGDAQALPFPDGSFDAVVSNFGMLHFADPDRALAEAFRVLRRPGVVAFTVWSPAAVGLGIAQSAAAEHGDAGAARLPPGPAFFRFSDAAEAARTLTQIGFVECDSTEIRQRWRLASMDDLLRALAEGTVRNRALLRSQPAAARAMIENAIRAALLPYRTVEGGLEIPMPAVLSRARR
jgi:SAM-dependent methyltransferase